MQNAVRSLLGQKDWGLGVGGDKVMQEEGASNLKIDAKGQVVSRDQTHDTVTKCYYG